jgi:hypothetical protein
MGNSVFVWTLCTSYGCLPNDINEINSLLLILILSLFHSSSFFVHATLVILNHQLFCSPIKNTLATVFDHSIPYSCPVASFGEDWGFVLAFNGPPSKSRQLTDLPPETINALIEERIRLVPGVPVHRYRSKGVKRATLGNETGGEVLKHYDGVSHRRLFAMSKMLREAMKSDDRIMTVENPIFMY